MCAKQTKKNIETKMVEKSSYSNYAYSLSHSNESALLLYAKYAD